MDETNYRSLIGFKEKRARKRVQMTKARRLFTLLNNTCLFKRLSKILSNPNKLLSSL